MNHYPSQMSVDLFGSDEALLSSLKRGDSEALRFVYKTYWPMISRFVRFNSGSDQDAEELYQEGIIALYEKVKDPNLMLSCSVKTYLYSVCRNKWLYQLRGRKEVIDIEDYIESNNRVTEEASQEMPEKEEIMEAINNLGDPCYSLLIGFYYQKLSLDMLAERLNYSTANVAKQQKFRCVERLKKFFLNKNYKYVSN